MAHLTAHNIDTRYATHNNVGRDINYNYYNAPTASGPSPSLSFNDAPIDFLTSHFTGREEELNRIGEVLSGVHGSAPNRCGVYAIPGMGKSQLMLQYVKLSYSQQRYSIVFWISGATLGKLNQGLAGVLTLVGHPDRDHPEQSTRLTSARRWLEESGVTKWLLVLDNVAQEAVSFLQHYLPRKNVMGNILFTTRTAVIAEALACVAGQPYQFFELRAPDLRDASNQLLKEAGISATDAVTNSMNGAEDLVKRIGCLPLAISHAGSFAKQSRKSLNDVLTLYRSEYQYELIAWENDLSTYEEKSVAVAFGIQLEELERRSSDFSNLLKVLSFLDPERISLDMIVEGGEELRSASYPIPAGTIPLDSQSRECDMTAVSPTFKSVIALICSPVQLQQAIQQFQRLSLVGYASNTDGSSLRIHDLIQTTIQEGARRQDARHQSFHIAAWLVCGAFRHVDDPASHKCWSQCEMFSPHIQSLTKWGDEYAAQMSELDEANIGIAQYLNSCGRYSEAEKLFGRVLAGKERQFGPEHPDTLAIVKSLAVVYGEQGRYDEAEVLFKRALAGQEKLLGSEHLTTLVTAEGLGVIYRRQKRYDEAEVLYGRSLAAKKNLFDPHHPDTLQTGDALGCVYHRQGRYAEAELLHSEALASREMLLGLDHPETLKTIHNLAIVLSSQGRCNEAEALWARALVGREKHLGSEHPDTLRTAAKSANTYALLGRYDEAEARYLQALAGREKVLGPEHPHTLDTVRDLVGFYKQQGRQEDMILLRNRFPPPPE